MLKNLLRLSGVAFLACLLVTPGARTQTNPSVEGTVKDAQTGDALPGANVILVGTSLGASADVNGKYGIRNVPPGSYTARAT
ncbi:MAG TPA: carboxypeptidase-like regulatory domain-containing protein, partial [Bacteroidota bacterium]